MLTAAAAAVLTSPPAAAQNTAGGGTVNAGNFVVTGGSVTPNPAAPGTHDTITTTAARTILDFDGFTLAAGNRLDIVVTSASDIVLIRVGGPSASHVQVNGFLNVTTGLAASPGAPAIEEVPTNVGGNVWFIGPNGVAFGGSSRVNAGGLLATSADVASQDFLGRQTVNFSGGTGSVTQDALSVITGNGGHVALIGNSVSQSGTIADPGQNTDVLLGGARGFTLGLAEQPGSATTQAILDFSIWPPDPHVPGPSSAFTPVTVSGSVRGANVYLVSDSSNTTSAVGPVVSGSVRAEGPAASRDGSLVVVSGGSLSRGDLGSFPRATHRSGALAQPITVLVPLHGAYQTVVAATGDLTLTDLLGAGSPPVLTGQQVVLSTGDDLSYPSGVLGAFVQRWVVYAPTPDDVPDPGLNSGRTAFWNGDITSTPPQSVIDTGTSSTDKRYVFDSAPDITVTADDKQKDFDAAYADGSGTPLSLTATISAPLHPGVPGLFTGDTGPAYTGNPHLTSPGARADAPDLASDGTYPITAALGTLVSSLRYDFVLVPGHLDVDDTSPPTVTPTVTGTLSNGWYTSDVGLSWVIEDRGTEPAAITGDAGCAGRNITADQQPTSYTCTGRSLGGIASPVTVSIGRDTTAPVLTVPAGPTGATDGNAAVVTWAPVSASDDLDASPQISCDRPPGDTFPLGATTVTCTATDHAGNTSSRAFTVTVRTLTADATFSAPIDAAPVMNIAKLGRVIPVKAALTSDQVPVTGPAPLPVHLSVSSGVTCTPTATTDPIEAYAAGSSNVGNLMRWDASSSRWAFNLDTSAFTMKPNACYRVTVHYGGTVVGDRASGGVPAGHFLVQTKK